MGTVNEDNIDIPVKDILTIEDVNIRLPDKYIWMKVKAGTKVPNMVTYAKKAIDGAETRSILWSGYGNAVGKTISCVEIIKKEYKLHQLTKICHLELNTEPHGLTDRPEITRRKTVPCIHILQSLDEIKGNEVGKHEKKETNGQTASQSVEPPRKISKPNTNIKNKSKNINPSKKNRNKRKKGK